MFSLPISVDSSQRFAMTSPVFNTPLGVIVRDHHRDSFRTWNGARQQGAALRVTVGAGPDSMSIARSLLPEATFVPISRSEQVKTVFESGAPDVDAMLHSSEHGAAWTLLFPEFSVVVPTPSSFLPFGYAVARGNDELLKPLNAWLGEQKVNGTVDALYRHWMLGQAAND